MPTVRLDGADIYYRESGDGSPVVLVHGSAGTADIWGGTFDELARRHRVVAYDRRGFRHSRSPPIADYHLHGEDAAGLIRALEAAPAAVVGWSGGGLAALDLAVHHPELVRALILVEPPLHASRHLTLQMAGTFLKLQLLRRLRGKREAVTTFLRWATSYRTGGCAFDALPAEVREAMLATADATLGDLDAGTLEELSMAQVAAIRCPVTCLRGELSPPALANATLRILRALPTARPVVIQGAGHAVHFDRPEEFAREVLAAAL